MIVSTGGVALIEVFQYGCSTVGKVGTKIYKGFYYLYRKTLSITDVLHTLRKKDEKRGSIDF